MTPDNKPTNPKDAIGSTKPPLSCVPSNVMFMLGVAMTEGSCKYGRHNYRVSGVRASVYYDAALRHLMRKWEGEDLDPDTGVPHLAFAMACLTIWMDADMNSMLTDDRPPKIESGWYDEIQRYITQTLDRHPNPAPPCTMDDDQPQLKFPGEHNGYK